MRRPEDSPNEWFEIIEDKATKKIWRFFLWWRWTACRGPDAWLQNPESRSELKGNRLPHQKDTQCPVTTDAVSQQPVLNTSIWIAEPVSAANDLQILGEEAAKQENKPRPSKPSCFLFLVAWFLLLVSWFLVLASWFLVLEGQCEHAYEVCSQA